MTQVPVRMVATILPSQLLVSRTMVRNVDEAQSVVGTLDPLLKCFTHTLPVEPVADGERRRKKRNRWGDAAENKAAGLMGLPTMIKANMTTEQLEAYTLHLRIQEISEKLRINDVVPADGDRYVYHSSTIFVAGTLTFL